MSLYRGKRLMARNTRFTCGQTQVMELASTIRFPDHHETGRNGSFPFPDRELKICGGHGPGETPGPIPNPEAKAWHGDGTALDRVWESSTPPHHTQEKPRYHLVSGLFAYASPCARILSRVEVLLPLRPLRGRLPSKRGAENSVGADAGVGPPPGGCAASPRQRGRDTHTTHRAHHTPRARRRYRPDGAETKRATATGPDRHTPDTNNHHGKHPTTKPTNTTTHRTRPTTNSNRRINGADRACIVP